MVYMNTPQGPAQLKRELMDLQRSAAQMNASLVKHLKRRDRHLARQQRDCDIVTAVIQASSLKRREYHWYSSSR
ncbi:TBC1 domain family member 30 [Elysia marginata]|uniref:TBC1 domain family member 30 n=1 Tax=Elysia marginata TaxID=1093978 RepID=A0AAV4FLF8_9GAST|nr:TBC1 domain family member 30 [Elysia marginata]